jgi:hypothetical protein
MGKSMCQCDPQVKELWGCEKPTQHVVWRDLDENEYYVCPIRCIPEEVINWYDEYKFYQEFSGSLKYHEIPAKWIEAKNTYNSYVNRYIEDQNSMNRKDNTAPLKSTVRLRKANKR